MGMDIHIEIYNKDCQLMPMITDEFEFGRDREWFDSIHYEYGTHAYLPKQYDTDRFNSKHNDKGYFGHFYMNVKAFKDWYEKYKPQLNAGWVSKFDAWEYKTRGIAPDEYYYHLNAEIKGYMEDYIWLEWEDEYCSDTWLYNKVKTWCDDDNYIYICFDW